MSLARALVRGRETRSPGGDWDKYVKSLLGQMTSTAAVVVNPTTAMKLGVFYDCVRILAEDTAKLPLFLYRRLPGGGKKKATDHPIYRLLHTRPNDRNTPMELRETVVGHMAALGNGYLYKLMAGGRYPESLWPLRPDRLLRRRIPNPSGPGVVKFYEYLLDSGEIRILYDRDVIHFRGFGFDGKKGYDLTVQAKESLGLAIGAERYAAAFFANDATPRTVLKHKKSFKTDTAAKEIRKSWEDRMRGLNKAHLVAILEDDMDVETIGLDAEAAQLLATREMNVEDVARWFRMPNHKVGALRKASYNNIEHQSLEYVVDTLTPPLVRVEQRLTLDLLPEDELDDYFIEHLVAGLLRGDFETRMKGYRLGREIGMYSVNDCLGLDNQNPIGPEGDIRHVPLNWVRLGDELAPNDPPDDTENDDQPADTAPPPPGEADEAQRQLLTRLERNRSAGQDRARDLRLNVRRMAGRLYEDAGAAIAKRELADVDRAVKRYLKKADWDGLRQWVVDFGVRHADFVGEKLGGPTEAYATALAIVVDEHLGAETDQDTLRAFAVDYVTGTKGRAHYYAGKAAAAVLAILDDERGAPEEAAEDAAEIHERLVDLAEQRADQIARIETVRAGEAIARQAYTMGGVTAFRWRKVGDSCKWADALEGQERDAAEPFLAIGQTLLSPIDSDTLNPSSDINHAPAHSGCDCYSEPVIGGDE